MSDFVHECEAEWRRLGVPSAIAQEMATDLRADLAEAEAEGMSAEHVLGNGVFDPRSFAATWAIERGLVAPPNVDRPRSLRLLIAIGVVFAALALAILGGLALVGFGHVSHASGVAPGPATRVAPMPAPPLAVFSHDPSARLLAVVLVGLGLFAIGIVALTVLLLVCRPRRWLRGSPHPSDLTDHYAT